jgi:hypothetical protein
VTAGNASRSSADARSVDLSSMSSPEFVLSAGARTLFGAYDTGGHSATTRRCDASLI